MIAVGHIELAALMVEDKLQLSALQDRAQLVWLRWSIMTDMATSLLYFDRCPNWHVADGRLHVRRWLPSAQPP